MYSVENGSVQVLKTPRHLAHLDGLRALSALYIVLHHAFLQSWPTPKLMQEIHGHWLTSSLAALGFGPYAVTTFIAISGFSLALPVVRGTGNLKTGTFFLKRARRILPPYYMTVILATVAALFIHYAPLTMYSGSVPVTSADVISHILLIHNLSAAHHTKVAGQLWSVAVECQIYLFFPLLVYVRARGGRNAALIGCFALAAVSLAASALTHASLPGLFFAVFGLGMYFSDRVFNAPAFPFGRIALLAGIASLILMPIVGASGFGFKLANLMVGLWASSLMAYCVIRPEATANRLLSHPVLASIGLFSYSLYLAHFTLQQILWEHFVRPFGMTRAAGFTLMATIGTAVILALSYGFFLMFERPFLTTKKPTETMVKPFRAATA